MSERNQSIEVSAISLCTPSILPTIIPKPLHTAQPLILTRRIRGRRIHSATPIQVSIHSFKQLTKNLHDSPAHKANTNHKDPTRDRTQTVDKIADRDKKSILREHAIRRVHEAFVGLAALVLLLAVYLEHVFRGYGGRVQVSDLKRCLSAFFELSLGNLEVPDGGSASCPGGTEDLLLFAV